LITAPVKRRWRLSPAGLIPDGTRDARLAGDIDGVQTVSATVRVLMLLLSVGLTYPRPLVTPQFRITAQSGHLGVARTSCATNTQSNAVPFSSKPKLSPPVKKNMPQFFCQYLRQILTDFKYYSTGTLCGIFAMKLLHIPPYFNCVATLRCEI